MISEEYTPQESPSRTNRAGSYLGELGLRAAVGLGLGAVVLKSVDIFVDVPKEFVLGFTGAVVGSSASAVARHRTNH